MFDTLKVHVKDMFLRGHTGDERPQGSLPSFSEGCCVRSSFEDLPSNCRECRYGANGNCDPTIKVACGHPDRPTDASVIVTAGMAKLGRQPWCPLTTGRVDS